MRTGEGIVSFCVEVRNILERTSELSVYCMIAVTELFGVNNVRSCSIILTSLIFSFVTSMDYIAPIVLLTSLYKRQCKLFMNADAHVRKVKRVNSHKTAQGKGGQIM